MRRRTPPQLFPSHISQCSLLSSQSLSFATFIPFISPENVFTNHIHMKKPRRSGRAIQRDVIGYVCYSYDSYASTAALIASDVAGSDTST